MDSQILYTPEQAAALLALGRSKVFELMADGRVASVQIGRSRRIPRQALGDDGSEDLRALLNAGHRKGATVSRCVGPRHDVARFPVFAAVAMAGLGDLPDTLMSRSVIIRMRRRAPGERIEPFRRRLHELDGENLRARLDEWTRLVRFDVADAWPEMPAGVEDRPADVWEPLLAIADAAGGRWPDVARVACVELCKVAESREASLGVRLLADLRDIFGDTDALATETILERLCDIDEAPWADLRGKPLDPRGLARRLRQYEVMPVKVKVDGRALKGYRREHLWDPWQRYLSPSPAQGEPGEPQEPRRSEASGEVPLGFPIDDKGNLKGTHDDAVTCDVPQVPQVPPTAGGERASVTEAVDAELTRRHQRLDLRPDGYHLQHRRDRNGRWTRQASWCDVGVPAFRTMRDVAAHLDLSGSGTADESLADPAGWPCLCHHGIRDGDLPDPFVNGRLRCPECALETAS